MNPTGQSGRPGRRRQFLLRLPGALLLLGIIRPDGGSNGSNFDAPSGRRDSPRANPASAGPASASPIDDTAASRAIAARDEVRHRRLSHLRGEFDRIAAGSPLDALHWLSGIPSSSHPAIVPDAPVFWRRLMSVSPREAPNALAELAPTPWSAELCTFYAAYLADHSHEAAVRWAESLPHATSREAAFREAWLKWHEHDATAAALFLRETRSSLARVVMPPR